MAFGDADLNSKRPTTNGAHSELQISFLDLMSDDAQHRQSVEPPLLVANRDWELEFDLPANDNDWVGDDMDIDAGFSQRAIDEATKWFDWYHKYGIEFPANDN